jgi:pimeloyl-ACP methyl ester carboxylesterase
VRTRRAYFDCKFGQLHVRTAFPTTGGFDEQVTLFCLHCVDASSRTFSRFLPEVADVRSVYAPDLPGYGESDPSPSRSIADAAIAISDLANELRLRQIDLLGIQYGAEVAIELAAARPELVRRLVLAGVPAAERPGAIKQPRLILDIAGRDDPFEGRTPGLGEKVSVPAHPALTDGRAQGETQQVHQRDRRLLEGARPDKWIDAGRVTCNGGLPRWALGYSMATWYASTAPIAQKKADLHLLSTSLSGHVHH